MDAVVFRLADGLNCDLQAAPPTKCVAGNGKGDVPRRKRELELGTIEEHGLASGFALRNFQAQVLASL